MNVGNKSANLRRQSREPYKKRACKKCSKPNHFAKMCRSQQKNEIVEKTSSSDEECNLIQSFDSCDEFEIMAIEPETSSMDQIDEYIKQKSKRKLNIGDSSKDIQKLIFAGTLDHNK